MPPVSTGRNSTYTALELKQAWKDYRALNPKGTKREFSKIVGLSYSRLKAILNDHPSEQRRKNKMSCSIQQSSQTTAEVDAEKPKKQYSGLMFFPS